MGFLFLDIETCGINGGRDLLPSEAKVIAIAYKAYPGEFTINDRVLKRKADLRILKEWERGEKEILRDFYQVVKDLKTQDEHLTLVGFNHTTFDLPFLYERMVAQEIASRFEVYDVLFRPFSLDLMQLSVIFNERFLTEYSSPRLSFLNQKALLELFSLPTKERTGDEIPGLYTNRKYDEIEHYIREENQYWEELYRSLAELLKNQELWKLLTGAPRITGEKQRRYNRRVLHP